MPRLVTLECSSKSEMEPEMSGESIEDAEEKGDEEREDLGERTVSGRDMLV